MKKWFRRQNIFVKFLIIGWSSILLIVLPSFLIMSYFLNEMEQADRVHKMTDNIIMQMLHARIAEKKFILRDLQNEKYLQDIHNRISGLRRAALNIPNVEAAQISQDLTAYENTFREFVALQKKVGRNDEEGLQGQFKKMIAKMETVVDQIMNESKLEYDKAKRDFRFMSLMIYLLGIAVGSTFYFFFARSVSMKLTALKNGVLQVGRGNLDANLPVTTQDEIGIVAEAFNKMTVDIKAATVSKNYVDKIIESMADMLIVVDRDRTIEKANRAALDLLGYSEKELNGQTVDVIFEDAKADPVFWDEIIRTKSVRNLETEMIAKDRHGIAVSLSGSLISDSGAIVCVAQDITERRRAEEMLRKSASELRLLSSKILEAQENERKRVARELHDGIGQALTGIKFALENGVRRLKKAGTARQVKVLEDITPLIQATVDETRRIAMGLRPSTLDDIGISETIYWFCQHYESIYKNIRILKLIEVEEDQIPETLKTVIFRVLQESLNNVAKHSGADRVQLSLRQQDQTVELIVEDNGSGFDLAKPLPQNAAGEGFGLAGMRERVDLAGGIFTIQSTPGQGTRIGAVWPQV